MRTQFGFLSLLGVCALLSGCAFSPDSVEQNAGSGAIEGKAFGGQQPISSATITIWQAGSSGYGTGATSLATTTTNSSGGFSFAANAFTCAYATEPVYITAAGGIPGGTTANPNIVLAAGLGTCAGLANTFVNINEVTTVATAYALGQFFTKTLGGVPATDLFGGNAAGAGTYNVGMVAANSHTIPLLVNLPTGQAYTSTAAMTTETAKIYTLANILAACVNTTGVTSTTETTTVCGKLFTDTLTPGTTTRPLDTLQAAVNMSLYPYQNVAALFALASTTSPYIGLSTVPNDLTLAVSYTSAAFGLGIEGTTTSSTSSTIDIDAAGNVWFPTNTTTSHGIGKFSPSTVSFSGPYATALVHPQYVTITQQGVVWASDTATAQIVSTSTTSPLAAGTVVATTGFTGPIAAGYSGTATDAIAFTGGGTATSLGTSLYQYTGTVSAALATYTAPPNGIDTYTYNSLLESDAASSGSSTACRYEFVGYGSGSYVHYVQATSSSTACYAGGAANTTASYDGVTTLSTGQLCDYGPTTYGGSCFTSPVTLTTPQALETDGLGAIWIANSGNGSLSTLGYTYKNDNSTDYHATSTLQYIHNSTNGSTMSKPYGLAIDRSGNVWTANAGCVSTTGTACVPGSFVLSELIGAAGPTITPLAVTSVNGTEGSVPTADGISGPIVGEGLTHRRGRQ